MRSLLEIFRDFAAGENIADTAFIVGGAVRDLILGKELKDIDIALKGDAPGIARRFAQAVGGSFVLLDSAFGIARVVVGDQFLDISRLRGDAIEEDLAARDITINAMAIPLNKRQTSSVKRQASKDTNSNSLDARRFTLDASRSLEDAQRITLDAPRSLIDPFNGREDLFSGVIRMVSEKNLVDDPLRLLRVFRFAGALGFSIGAATRDAVARHARLIQSAAAERISDELRHILTLDRSSRVITDMSASGLLQEIFPEVRMDLWEHTLPLYERAEGILADTTAYFPMYADSIARYFHATYRKAGLKLSTLFPGPDEAKNAALRLKMSAREVEFIFLSASGGRQVLDMHEQGAHPDAKSLIPLFKRLQDDIYPCIILAIARAGSHPGELGMLSFGRAILSFYHEEIRPRMEMPPLITGDDLIGEFRLQPSPLFKSILDEIEDKTLAGELLSREDALRTVREMLETGRY